MGKTKRILTNWRVIVLLIAVLLAVLAIHPAPWATGVVIKAVEKNSSASLAGIQNPSAEAAPLSKERVLAINGKSITSVSEYYDMMGDFRINQTIQLKTTARIYQLKIQPEIVVTKLNTTESKVVQETIAVNQTVNGSVVQVNKTINKTIQVPKTLQTVKGPADIGLTVDEAPVTNLRKGLDLQGGTRVILKPVGNTSPETIGLLVDSLNERLNVYGLSDILITTVGGSELLGQSDLIVVEIAGATAQEVSDLVQQQGKFEGTIANKTILSGANKDITYVCRTADCSGLDPYRGCYGIEGGIGCSWRFDIALTPDAANTMAEATRNLAVVGTGTDRYLSENINLYLDDELVTSLRISASLRGQQATGITISGFSGGISDQEARTNAAKEMRTLQTVLITGSLPTKLEIVKIDTISPALGPAFIKNAILLALLSTAAVAIVLTLVYRRLAIAIPIILTAVFELTLVLGIAAVLRWQLDLASIAGLIIAIGTGVNDQIIITDEALRRESGGSSFRERIKRAFFVVMAAYFTNAVAMIALWTFGAGLLKGFALTTILAVTVGVLVTRPAYAAIVNILVEE